MNISPARIAAYDILLRIETERAFSSALLPFYEDQLSVIDRSLCHEITLGVLRYQMYLDRLIDTLVGGKRLDIQVRIAIRIALYQLRYLDKIPDYSAINESVNLVQRARKTSAKGFVNAILRRSLREQIDLAFVDEVDKVSVMTSNPRWLLERWINAFGKTAAFDIAESNNKKPVTAFRVLKDGPEIAALVASAVRSKFVAGCLILESFDPRVLSLVESGAIYVQDEASQIAAAAVDNLEHGRFLDVCAAPGGKSGAIAHKSPNADLLLAGDLHWHRVQQMRANCLRQGLNSVQIVQYDAVKGLPFEDKSLDSILVDAPCSGTGTIRHNPELRYLLSASDIEQLPGKQLSILSNASKLARAGGTVVYTTCSMESEENEDVCGSFLSENPDFQLIEPGVHSKFKTEDGFARTWPQRDNMDGFFIARFRRK